MIDRPAARDPAPSEGQAVAEGETAGLVAALTAGVPEDVTHRTAQEHARWLLAQLLGWHRREARSQWWDYYRRREMSSEDLVLDTEAIGVLVYEGVIGQVKRSELHRYRFDPTQLHKIGKGDSPHDPRTGKAAGTVHAIDNLAGTIDLSRGVGSSVPHPGSLIPASPISSNEQRMAIERVARRALEFPIGAPGPYRAVLDLLLRQRPRVSGTLDGYPLDLEGEEVLAAARRVVQGLDSSYLPIQGPPGSGKTWMGARMIVELVKAGRRVGIAATSHKAICNLMDAVCAHATDIGVDIRAIQRSPEDQRCGSDMVRWAKDNPAVDGALVANEVDVVAGTAWLFARQAMEGALDTIFIDEAGQMSMADVVAVGTAARNLVLLGDPQQLAHPSQGIHPPGAGVSALDHILDGRQTVLREAGLFLDTTFRMHPDVCAFISEVAYEGRLGSDAACALQALEGGEPVGGTGIRYLPVHHRDNRTVSREEIAVVAELVRRLMGRRWTDSAGQGRTIRPEDVLVVAPYNAHVDRLQVTLPVGCAAGTVDRFQGQEAPVVIYSLATSSPEDMPRKMEFLYSLNRLNVAISRARGLAILVCSPALLGPRCRRPEQMRLASAFCRLVELASRAAPPSAVEPPTLTVAP